MGMGNPGICGAEAIMRTVPYTVRAVVLVSLPPRMPVIWLLP